MTDNLKLPKIMYLAHHEDDGWFHSSLSDDKVACLDHLHHYDKIDYTKITIREVEVKELP